MNTSQSSDHGPAAPSSAKGFGPLEGVRVLDLTSVILGPLATQVLADYGADVIKIEGPGGDLMRYNGASRHTGMGSIFLALNRNKRSVLLDLKTAEGTEAMRGLIRDADVLVHNMRVAAIERLGFGYEQARSLNSRIVYCAATGFQQSGPQGGTPAFDDTIQAACGLVDVGSGDGDPQYMKTLIADKTTALAVSNAVMAALFHRERQGVGQYVEVPMLETMAAFVLAEHMGEMTFSDEGQPGYARLLQGGRQLVRTAEGWLSVMPYTPRHWQMFLAGSGSRPAAQPVDTADPAKINANIRTLYEQLREITPTKTTDAWLAICAELDIPATRIYRLQDLPHHPQLAAVGLFEKVEHPTEGTICQLRPTTLFGATPLSVRRHAPQLGQHTAEILGALRDA